MILAFSGPPCSGKSTLSRSVARSLGVPHVSSGALIRDWAATGDPEAMALHQTVRDGTLAPPAAMLDLVGRRLAMPDCSNGFVVDGFPRLVPEARAFLRRFGRIEAYVRLHADDETLAERASGRGREDDGEHAYRMEIYRRTWPEVLAEFENADVPVVEVDAELDATLASGYVLASLTCRIERSHAHATPFAGMAP